MMRLAFALLLVLTFLTCQGTSQEYLDEEGVVDTNDELALESESYEEEVGEDLGKQLGEVEELDVGIKQNKKLSHCEVTRTFAATHRHICALKEDQTVLCTGRDMTKDSKPIPPPAGTKFQMIAAGWNNFCGVTVEGEIKCWGHSHGGNADVNDCYGATLDPAKIPKDKDFVKVDLNICMACGLKKDNSIKCWHSTTKKEVKNIKVPTEKIYIDIATTHDAFCGITKDGGIKCTGYNHDHGTVINIKGNFVSIQMGHANGLALRADGTLYFWGKQNYGSNNIPVGLRNVKEISMKYYTPCALLMDNSFKCWGRNNVGQLTGLPADKKYKAVFANYNVCYLSLENKLKCTGHNADNQLSINDEKETWSEGGSTCPLPQYLETGPGKCSDWQQHGPKQLVQTIDECRDTCFTFSREAYFAIQVEDSKKYCICYGDCDERTAQPGWTVYEVLSDKVSQLIMEKDVDLSKRGDHVTACDVRMDRCEKKMAFVKQLEKNTDEQRWKKAEVKFPTPPITAAAEAAVANAVTPEPSCGGNFMGKIGFLMIGSVLGGSLVMFLGATNNKRGDSMPLMENI